MLYTPPEEACSEDIKPKCGTRSMPRAPALCPRLKPPPWPRPAPPPLAPCLRAAPPTPCPRTCPRTAVVVHGCNRVLLRSEREVHVVLDPLLGLKLRPHQREGVTVRFDARIPP